MKLIWPLLLFLLGAQSAWALNFRILGVSAGIEQPEVHTAISSQETKEEVVKFLSNNPQAVAFGVNTTLGNLGYFIDIGNGHDANLPATRYLNFYYKIQLGSFDLRLTYLDFKGAYIEAEKHRQIYKDYRQKGISSRLSYYFDKKYLDRIQFDATEVDHIGKKEIHGSYSFLGTLYYTHKNTNLPSVLQDETNSRFSAANFNLPSGIEKSSVGLLGGIDVLIKKYGIFLNGKLTLGYGYKFTNRIVTEGASVKPYKYEIPVNVDISLGSIFKERHKVVLSADISKADSTVGNAVVDEGVLQFSVLYTYYLF